MYVKSTLSFVVLDKNIQGGIGFHRLTQKLFYLQKKITFSLCYIPSLQ